MTTLFGLFNLGGSEIILILALVLILFGARKLPELAKGLGQGIKEFKKATREVTDEIQHSVNENHYSPPPPAPPPPKQLSEPAPTEKAEGAPESTEQKA